MQCKCTHLPAFQGLDRHYSPRDVVSLHGRVYGWMHVCVCYQTRSISIKIFKSIPWQSLGLPASPGMDKIIEIDLTLLKQLESNGAMESSCFLLLDYFKTNRFWIPARRRTSQAGITQWEPRHWLCLHRQLLIKGYQVEKIIRQEYPSKLISPVLTAMIQSEIQFGVSGTMEAHVDNVAHHMHTTVWT